MKSSLFVICENADSLDRLRSVLSGGVFAPRCFATLEEFLALLPKRQLGCVVINLTGGSIDDPAIVAAIRERAPRLQVVVLVTEAVETAWRDAGAYAVLSKPCASPLLLATVAQAIDAD